MSPQRIQRKRTKGWRMPPNTVYVGRPTRWGNPFVVHQHTDNCDDWHGTCPDYPVDNAEIARDQYRRFVLWPDQGLILPTLDEIRVELAGKNLACWCPEGAPCHADILLKIAVGEDI